MTSLLTAVPIRPAFNAAFGFTRQARTLLYRGPGLAELHEHARAGGLDERAGVRAAVDISIAAPVATVWELLTDFESWPARDFGVTAVTPPARVAPGEEFHWTNGGMPIVSRLAVVDPERELTWTGVTYGIKAIHRQVLSDDGHGGCLLHSEETMAAPLLAVLYPSRKLHRDLTTFVTAFGRTAEAVAASA